jgi:YD repeat-containing protein
LLELLNIQGESGNEGKVARYVRQQLDILMFVVHQDDYGNILAEKRFAEGPVILLSAHMDTVLPFSPHRQVIWEGVTLRSSAGILGADDRAGIAIILEAIRLLDNRQPQGRITEMSCDGHGKRAPHVWFACTWNAAWFELLLDSFLEQDLFHYQWFIEKGRSGSFSLTAQRFKKESWRLDHIQQDTC